MGRTPKPRSKRGFRPFAAARFPTQAAVTAITSCVTMMHADINGAAAFGLPFDSISQLRQHRGIGQVKKKRGCQEIEKNAVLEEGRQSRRLRLALFLDRSTNAGVVDLGGIYSKKGHGCGNGEQRGNHEDRAVTKFVADKCDEQGGENVPGGIECLILPKLLVKSTGPNNPECDSCNCGREKSS